MKIFFVCIQNGVAGSQLHVKEGVYSLLSLRAHMGGFSVSDNIKKIHKSQYGTQMLNIPGTLYMSQLHMAQALLWLEVYILTFFL